MENPLAMSGARGTREAAFQESERAVGILPARCRERVYRPARPRRRLMVRAQVQMEHQASFEPTPDSSQPGPAGTEQQKNIQHRTSSFQLPMGPCLAPCSMFGVVCWMLDVLVAAAHR